MGEGDSPHSSATATRPSPDDKDAHGSARKAHVTRDLTTGSIPRNLWFLAWPQLIESVLNIVDQVADIIWAGRIGARAIAGLGVAQSYAGLAMTGRMGFDTAMRAMIARAVGSRDIALANHVALQAFTLSGIYSFLMVALGIFFTEPLMRVLGVSDAVVAEGAGYMRVMFLGQFGFAFRLTSGAALQASGDAVTPLKATTATRVAHILLSPCLVFGWFFFPEWGLAGASAANVFANIIGIFINFHALFTGKSRLHLTLRGYRVDLPLLWQITKLGVPASLTNAERTIAHLMLIGLVAPFGDFALAAFSLTRRTEMISHFTSMAMGQAAGIVAGQSLGANKPARAKTTVFWGVGFITVIHFVLGAILLVIPEAVVLLFNDEPELVGFAAIWLQIQALGFIFNGAGMVLMQSFNTAGDTIFPMLVTLVSIWGIQQPLAMFLPGVWDLGQFGIGWAVNVSILVRMVACIFYFFWGPWMKKNPLVSRTLAKAE